MDVTRQQCHSHRLYADQGYQAGYRNHEELAGETPLDGLEVRGSGIRVARLQTQAVVGSMYQIEPLVWSGCIVSMYLDVSLFEAVGVATPRPIDRALAERDKARCVT